MGICCGHAGSIIEGGIIIIIGRGIIMACGNIIIDGGKMWADGGVSRNVAAGFFFSKLPVGLGCGCCFSFMLVLPPKPTSGPLRRALIDLEATVAALASGVGEMRSTGRPGDACETAEREEARDCDGLARDSDSVVASGEPNSRCGDRNDGVSVIAGEPTEGGRR